MKTNTNRVRFSFISLILALLGACLVPPRRQEPLLSRQAADVNSRVLASVDSGVHVLFDSICVVPVFAPPHLLHHILCAFFAVWKPRTPSWSPDQGPTRSVLSVGYGILFHSFICSSVSCVVTHHDHISRFPTQKCQAISEGKHSNVDKKSQKNASDKRGK